MPGKLRVTLVKSPIGHTQRTRATMRALGLNRINDTVDVADTPELRGMARAIRFLVRVEEVSDTSADVSARPSRSSRAAAEKEATE